jgi:predicted metal-dependent peptidase
MNTPALERIRNASIVLIARHPHLGVMWGQFSVKEAPGIGTMDVNGDGEIRADPAFVLKVEGKYLPFCLAHEMFHPVAQHFDRRKDRDPDLWNEATDAAINYALKADGFEIPEWVIMPPDGYTGPIQAEAIYDYMAQQTPPTPKGGQGSGKGPGQGSQDGQGQDGDGEGEGEGSGKPAPKPGAGCGMRPGKGSQDGQGEGDGDGEGSQDGQGDADGQGQGQGQGQPIDWGQVARSMQAMASVCNSGSGVCGLVTPLPARTDWRKVIRTGCQHASSNPQKTNPTFSKRNRRSPENGPQLPGYEGRDPKLAIVIDDSSSMPRGAIQRIIGETLKIAREYPGTRIYLVAHTDRVVWEGWITFRDRERVIQASGFEGGTNPEPAYRAVERAGKFDALVHFTDGELWGRWPTPPVRRTIVGLFPNPGGHVTQAPEGAIVIECEMDT